MMTPGFHDRSDTVAPTTIERAVIEILARQALRPPESIAPEAAIETLGIDSMGMAEVIFAIEERFDIAVPFDGARIGEGGRGMDLTTVAGVVAAVEVLLAGTAPMAGAVSGSASAA